MIDNNIIRSFSIFGKKERKKIYIVMLIQVLLGSLDLIGVVMLGLLGSRVISGSSSQPIGDRTANFLDFLGLLDKPLKSQVVYLALLAFFVLVLKTFISLYLSKKSIYFLSRRAAIISSSLISKLLSQSILVIQKDSYQKTINTLTYGVTTIAVNIVGSIIYLVADLAMLVILVFGLFIIDPLISLLTFIIFTGMSLLIYKFLNLKIKKLGSEQLDFTVKSNEKISEVLESYRELIVRNRRSYYASEISELRHKLADSLASNTFYQSLSKYILEITIIFGIVIISTIEFATQSPGRAATVISIFLAASTRIGPGVMRIQQTALNLKNSSSMAAPALDLIEDLIDVKPILGSNDWFDLNYLDFEANIILHKVNFRYPEKTSNTITNLSLKIPNGTITAIVGPSGAGKTTLVDLLLGVLEPNSGEVLISGIAPQDAISKWPGSISYVPQNTVILNGTIEDNILMGYKKFSESNHFVENAIKMSQLEDLINELPNGKKTQVGEKGTKLSGGQRQRIGIARALLSKPRVLVLDEATSSLDGVTESRINSSIQSLKGSVTVIVVAHRLVTVKNADLVVYISNGQIEAFGSFQDVRNKVSDFDEQAKLMGL